jgi:hypothetical protein
MTRALVVALLTALLGCVDFEQQLRLACAQPGASCTCEDAGCFVNPGGACASDGSCRPGSTCQAGVCVGADAVDGGGGLDAGVDAGSAGDAGADAGVDAGSAGDAGADAGRDASVPDAAVELPLEVWWVEFDGGQLFIDGGSEPQDWAVMRATLDGGLLRGGSVVQLTTDGLVTTATGLTVSSFAVAASGASVAWAATGGSFMTRQTTSVVGLFGPDAGVDAGVVLTLTRAECGLSSGVSALAWSNGAVALSCGPRLAFFPTSTPAVVVGDTQRFRFGLACAGGRCAMPVVVDAGVDGGLDGGLAQEAAVAVWEGAGVTVSRVGLFDRGAALFPLDHTGVAPLSGGDLGLMWVWNLPDAGAEATFRVLTQSGVLMTAGSTSFQAAGSAGFTCGGGRCLLAWDNNNAIKVRQFDETLTDFSAPPASLPNVQGLVSSVHAARGRYFLSVEKRQSGGALYELSLASDGGVSFLPLEMASDAGHYYRVVDRR